MRIAVWKTGHEIADTVAEALAEGLNGDIFFASNSNSFTFSNDTVSVAYGILRGTDKVFRQTSDEEYKGHWFNVDRGYFNPGHFDGYYRISYKGTQAQFNELRKPIDIDLRTFRLSGRSVMVCPPTQHVCNFFGIDLMAWIDWATNEAQSNGYSCFVRSKGDSAEINYDDIKAVITFNSSVGWQALQKGIPVLSDVKHSIIGSHYNVDSLNKLTKVLHESCDSRRELFECMRAHQFTLEEIRQGQAWPLIKHYMSISDSMTVNPLLPMSAPIPYGSGLKRRFQSNTSSIVS